jgi:hypothetical protein
MEPSFHTVRIPPSRTLVVDAGILGSKRHVIYGLVEADVTKARELLRSPQNKNDKEKVSFTAYLVACLAQAVAADPLVQAYKHGRNSLVVFHDVDVVTMIEPSEGAVAIPHIIRNANTKTAWEITAEIAAVKNHPTTSQQHSGRLVRIAPKIPRCLRMLFFHLMKRNPHGLREKQGTVMLTSVGMFGRGGGWGITFLPLHTIGVTIGGIHTKPAIVNGEILPRELLSITIAFDHDIIDGAPAARFTSRFVEIVETSAELLLLQQCADLSKNTTADGEVIEIDGDAA